MPGPYTLASVVENWSSQSDTDVDTGATTGKSVARHGDLITVGVEPEVLDSVTTDRRPIDRRGPGGRVGAGSFSVRVRGLRVLGLTGPVRGGPVVLCGRSGGRSCWVRALSGIVGDGPRRGWAATDPDGGPVVLAAIGDAARQSHERRDVAGPGGAVGAADVPGDASVVEKLPEPSVVSVRAPADTSGNPVTGRATVCATVSR